MKVFLSYGHGSAAQAGRLAARLAEEGMQPVDPTPQLEAGEDWSAAIERDLQSADAFVFVLEPGAERDLRLQTFAVGTKDSSDLVAARQAAEYLDTDHHERVFDAALRSFRPLTLAEAENIHPNRIDLYTAREGDTWQSIASRGGGLVRASDLAIMNRYEVSDQPQPGDRIKIVVIG